MEALYGIGLIKTNTKNRLFPCSVYSENNELWMRFQDQHDVVEFNLDRIRISCVTFGTKNKITVDFKNFDTVSIYMNKTGCQSIKNFVDTFGIESDESDTSTETLEELEELQIVEKAATKRGWFGWLW